MNGTAGAVNRVACHKCSHYLVTWNSRFPHGCRAHKIKSRKNPALEVYEASGLTCQLFAPKQPTAVTRAALR